MKKRKSGARWVKSCKGCRKSFEVLAIRVRAGKGLFCSKECYDKHRSGERAKVDLKRRDVIYQKKCKYGLTEEQYLALFKVQDNKCSICKISFERVKAMVDHCHKSNVVRGLLCNKCNSVLGMAGDDVNVLMRAIKYLQDSKKRVIAGR